MDTFSVMITGVGGQGTLLASRVIGEAALKSGYDVKMSEVHGMAQRGGSVVTYVRFGQKVNSPVICKQGADIILAFEMLEAKRWLKFLKKKGKLIMNTQKIDPMPVITGAEKYPDNIQNELKEKISDITQVDALSLAKKAGSTKAVNTVLIGILAKSSNINKDIWIEAVKRIVKPKFVDLNLKAFESGYNLK